MFITTSQTSDNNSIFGIWFYKDDYTIKQLILKDNHRFNWYFSSCEGDNCFKGRYYCKTDTIFLHPRKGESLKYVFRDGKIYSYPGENCNYPDFEPLKKITKPYNLKCNYDEIKFDKIE